MAKKMPRRLVALSSSAIAAIYLAGFAYTRGADAGLAPSATSVPTTVTATSAAQPTVAVSTSAAPSATPVASPPTATASRSTTPATLSSSPTTSTVSLSTSTSPATATAAAATTAASAYRDGTYTGTGTSRRGDVSVSVTVLAGRITNVTITSVNTQYPVSRITSLPAQVISRQSSQVDNVSGATYSAQAFRLAVQAALGKATA